MSIDISKHPLIKQAYEVCQAIEKCGASTELTDAVTKASALMQEIANLTGRMDELEAAEKKTVEIPTFDGYVPHVARELQAAFRIACDNAGINVADAAGKGEAS